MYTKSNAHDTPDKLSKGVMLTVTMCWILLVWSEMLWVCGVWWAMLVSSR
jgi:hypothetical protein